MQYGFIYPFADRNPREVSDLAADAERAGWDAFFVFEAIYGVDAWVTLAACAMRTERLRLGTMLTPLPRMRPWKLASEVASLDNLSNGRVILAVGLGAPDTGYADFGEVTDRRTRAELLDEGLEIVTGLWKGQPFRFEGRHFRIREHDFLAPPPPVQKPRVPIWVVGAWNRPKSMRRALRYDGLLPNVMENGAHRPMTPDDVREMQAFVNERHKGDHFDIVVEGKTPSDDPGAARKVVARWREAGATVWLEEQWATDPNSPSDPAAVRERVVQGPPRQEQA